MLSVRLPESRSAELEEGKKHEKYLPERQQRSSEGWGGCGKAADDSRYSAGLCA